MYIQLPPPLRPSTAPVNFPQKLPLASHQPLRSPPLPHLFSNLLQFLSSHSLLTQPKLLARPSVPSHLLTLWDRTHDPHAIPQDLGAFYLTTDGISLTYAANISPPNTTPDKPLVGEIHIFPLDKLLPFTTSPPSPIQTYYTLTTSPHGTTLLSFPTTQTQPQTPPSIAFHSNHTSKTYPIATSFTSYFRLAIAHCGISGWELLYTPQGPPPDTENWLNYLVPDRARLIRKVRVAREALGRQKGQEDATGDEDKEQCSGVEGLVRAQDANQQPETDTIDWSKALSFWDSGSKDDDIPFDLEKVEAMVALVEKGKGNGSAAGTSAPMSAKPPLATGMSSSSVRRPYSSLGKR
ncbi:hypothetical protein HK097_009759 [Rhizophlyctis rosea]|uniref:Uncharacterized protein n=1 Tax=Rhizophlyctis rosea TaxID=64517 RepID=A0AAD5SBJ4_9FUNG|nr:hypothetical protein HK097_009759 [Rhizophlyctis rosea]